MASETMVCSIDCFVEQVLGSQSSRARSSTHTPLAPESVRPARLRALVLLQPMTRYRSIVINQSPGFYLRAVVFPSDVPWVLPKVSGRGHRHREDRIVSVPSGSPSPLPRSLRHWAAGQLRLQTLAFLRTSRVWDHAARSPVRASAAFHGSLK